MRRELRRSRMAREGSLFEEQANTPTMVHEPRTMAVIVDALAQLLLEAARPNRSARDGGGPDDESQDHD
jgi:hypothetical protein